MKDEKGQDDKIIAVHVDDQEYAHYTDVSQLPPHRVKEIQRFFLDYKTLENKIVNVEHIRGRVDAENVLRDAVKLYDKKILPGLNVAARRRPAPSDGSAAPLKKPLVAKR
jgi:inorganic pyrophosphatase